MRVGLEGTGHWDRRQGALAQQSPTEPCVSPGHPQLGAPTHLLRPWAGLGRLCHHGVSVSALHDRAAGAARSRGQCSAERGTTAGPQPARGASSHSPGSHRGSVTLGWRGSETPTTEGPKPTGRECRGWCGHAAAVPPQGLKGQCDTRDPGRSWPMPGPGDSVDIPFGQRQPTQQYRTGSRERGWESALGQRRMAE